MVHRPNLTELKMNDSFFCNIILQKTLDTRPYANELEVSNCLIPCTKRLRGYMFLLPNIVLNMYEYQHLLSKTSTTLMCANNSSSET